ncbi:MAG: hypothetical protein ACYS15_06645 [Planctomycetota bacterium]
MSGSKPSREAVDLFQAAVQLPDSQRRAFLDEQCGEDDKLKQEVHRGRRS